MAEKRLKKRRKVKNLARPLKKIPIKESSELKRLEKELKKTRIKVEKQIEIDEKASSVTGLRIGKEVVSLKERILLRFRLKPSKTLEKAFELDYLVRQKSYADALELFYELNIALQKDMKISPEEKKEAYRLLYFAYKRMQNSFFPDP